MNIVSSVVIFQTANQTANEIVNTGKKNESRISRVFCDYGYIQTPKVGMAVGTVCVCLIIKPSFARHFLFSCSFHFITLFFFSLFLLVCFSRSRPRKTEKQKSDTQTGIALRGWFSAIIIEPPEVWSLCSSYHGICQWLPQERLHATGCFPSKH